MGALRVDGLTVELGGRAVVSDLRTNLGDGEWVVVIGPNGAGKTTALRAAAGHLPYGGSVQVGGREVAALSRRELAREVALVPQSPVTPPELRVDDYVMLGRTPYIPYFGRESSADVDAVGRALARLGLERFADRPLGSLSGGERQRAVLARALAQDAPLLLLDEPTSALDIGRQQEALELVDGLRREFALTVLAAMHDLTLAGQYADRMLLMSAGRVVAEGRSADVLTEWRIGAHYGATVDVLARGNGAPAVVPRRASARMGVSSCRR